MQVSSPSLVAQDPAEAPWGWSRQFRMPVFKPGTRVRRAGSWETASHEALRREDLAVYLVGRAEPVDPLDLELEPTLFTTVRVPERH